MIPRVKNFRCGRTGVFFEVNQLLFRKMSALHNDSFLLASRQAIRAGVGPNVANARRHTLDKTYRACLPRYSTCMTAPRIATREGGTYSLKNDVILSPMFINISSNQTAEILWAKNLRLNFFLQKNIHAHTVPIISACLFFCNEDSGNVCVCLAFCKKHQSQVVRPQCAVLTISPVP